MSAHRVEEIVHLIGEKFFTKEKVEKWAAKNAYTLIFLSFMFFVTWLVLAVILWRQ